MVVYGLNSGGQPHSLEKRWQLLTSNVANNPPPQDICGPAIRRSTRTRPTSYTNTPSLARVLHIQPAEERKEEVMEPRSLEREGFTLIEAVITMAIIAISIAALLSVINISSKLQTETEKEIAAKNEARRLIEAMKGYTCEQIVTMYAPEQQVSVSSFRDGDEATGLITVDDTDPTLLDVAVRVRWKIGQVGGQKRFRTFEVKRRMSDQDNG